MTRGRLLAVGSWIAFACFVTLGLMRLSGSGRFFVMARPTGFFLGVALAVAALVHTRWEGRDGIVVPATIGLLLNGVPSIVWTVLRFG